MSDYLLIGGAFLGLVTSVITFWGAMASIAKSKATEQAYNERISENEKATVEAKKDAAIANMEAERLRASNIDLERLVISRRWIGPSGRGELVERFGEYAAIYSKIYEYRNTKVLIQYVPDFEAIRLANDIVIGLKLAGWNVTVVEPNKSHVPHLSMDEGVEIWTNKAPDTAWNAAKALAATFVYEKISAANPTLKLHRDDTSDNNRPKNDIRLNIPENTVVILIGMKPTFGSLWSKESERERQELDRQMH